MTYPLLASAAAAAALDNLISPCLPFPPFPSSFIFQEVLVANVRLSRQSQILSDEIATAQRLEDLSNPFNR